jgi:glycosyltransferase involved in cell wall biosynthesis
MRLSVLIPARNAVDTIGASLSSTLRALPRDSEVLVLDDGSTDGTGDRARAVRDERLRVIRSDSPSGVAGALNHLLQEAQGEFIARMDADDVVLPGRFRLQLARLSPDLDLLFGGVVHFGSHLRMPYPSPPLAMSPRAFPTALLIDNPVAHSTLLARRSTMNDLGGYRNCLAEDYDLWLRAASNGRRIGRLSVPLIALRRHPGQVTADAGWAARAAAEDEWQESYAALAVSEGAAGLGSQVLHDVNAADSIQAKRAVIRSAIARSVQEMSPTDRLAIRLLSRRGRQK